MDKIRIRGGNPLVGEIVISGAKNAALPLMTACLLTDGEFILDNVPQLSDIDSLLAILEQMGVKVEVTKHDLGQTLKFNVPQITNTTAPYDLVRKMRASILVLGPTLARAGEAYVSLPGGCAIGTRPVDLHIKGLEALGAEITLEEGYVHAKAPGGLKGGEFAFPVVSVTGTENVMMAAVLARGTTRLLNAAREPEVVDLANCLVGMGAKIEGIGTDTLTIHGVEKLHGYRHSVMPDRIEAGTYAIAAAITKGDILLKNTSAGLLPNLIQYLKQCGITVEETASGEIRVNAKDAKLSSLDVHTEPFPGFPTDLQAQWMALMTLADGASVVTENIFENRFMHVPELARMGANISVNGSSAVVKGVKSLTGAQVMATDLRASVSLVLAGLAAEGDTIVNRIYHLDRGYEKLDQKLGNCGADIVRIAD